MAKDIVWEWLDRPGLEHLSLEIGPTAITARGLVLVQLGPAPMRVAYAVDLDGDWRFRHAHVTVDRDRTLDIVRAADGRWTVGGQARPDLAACQDIDIMVTPFTNSLPIRRLSFEPGRPRTIEAAYIRLPDLAVEAVAQEYTRLEPTRFRYRGLSSGFSAEPTVDGDGLVLDYPPIWRRRSDRSEGKP
ncbi:MAG: hypothetical protein JWO51_5200 [Rhodospirillales bacterium]|nr:hypothetical protein [Rhodospirillales bacterium]